MKRKGELVQGHGWYDVKAALGEYLDYQYITE